MARKKSILKAKEPIRIRQKALSNGNKSIYLDIYSNGARCYEFLRLYIIPETDAAARAANEATMQAANAIKAQRILELTNKTAGIKSTAANGKLLLLDYMRIHRQNQLKRGYKGLRQIDFTIKLLEAYRGAAVRMQDVDKAFCMGFLQYLTTGYITPKYNRPLKKVTAQNYYRCFNCALNAAVRAEIIAENPFNKIASTEKIHVPESKRQYLTAEEIVLMEKNPCKSAAVKQAYLFSCFCGLRISDIENLTWGDIVETGGKVRIEKVMKKTQQPLYLPLNLQAQKYLPHRGASDTAARVFCGLPSQAYTNILLQEWGRNAGITKHLTFHTARHTFATLSLTAGADLYTTSKLLGHADISTTQIYAKIVNEKKEEAVNLLDKLFE